MAVDVLVAEREQPGRPEAFEARVVTAVLACVARQGIRKTTLDDVAREAGCSRATVYRYFAGKPAVLAAAARVEAERIAAALQGAAADATTLEDAVVAILVTAGAELGHHPALGFVATFEPERLLPHLAFADGDRVLAAGAEILAPTLAPFVGPDHAPRAAEWVARVGLALLCSPTSPIDLDDPSAVRAYAREFVVPGIDAGTPVPFASPTRR